MCKRRAERRPGADTDRGEGQRLPVAGFVYDQMVGGRCFRILNVIEDVTREYLAAIPDTSISGQRMHGYHRDGRLIKR